MNSEWLNIALLEDYLDGKLDSKTMHKIERRALEDPFVEQALAGLSESPKRASASLSLLQKQLHDRIAQQHFHKKKRVFTWQRLSIGSAAAVMFITVSMIFFMRDRQRRDRLENAGRQPKNIEVTVAPAPGEADTGLAAAYAAVSPDSLHIRVKAGRASSGSADPKAPLTVTADHQMKQASIAAAAPEDTVKHAVAGTNRVAAASLTAAQPAVSAPVGGWAGLDSYLTDHQKLNKEANQGKFVELRFTVEADGTPSGFDIVKSAGPELDEEAVRLIKNGPKWEQPKVPGSKVNYTVAF